MFAETKHGTTTLFERRRAAVVGRHYLKRLGQMQYAHFVGICTIQVQDVQLLAALGMISRATNTDDW